MPPPLPLSSLRRQSLGDILLKQGTGLFGCWLSEMDVPLVQNFFICCLLKHIPCSSLSIRWPTRC